MIKRAQELFPDNFFFSEVGGASPNEAMRAAARRGLEDRRKYGRGGTLVGVARARDIANGRSLSKDTVRRMHSFFSRHSAYKNRHNVKEKDGGPTAAKISWDLWGGDAGAEWAKRVWESLAND